MPSIVKVLEVDLAESVCDEIAGFTNKDLAKMKDAIEDEMNVRLQYIEKVEKHG